MKHLFLSAAALLLLMLAPGCSRPVKIVENPLIEASTNPSVDITRAELTDSSTVLTVTVSPLRRTVLELGPDISITCQGKKYPMTGTEGLDAGNVCRVPDSGTASFRLEFGPVPEDAESLDLDFRYSGRKVTLAGVDLSGKKEYGLPEGLPRGFGKVRGNRPVPEPVFACGETSLKIHCLHYRKEMVQNLTVLTKTVFGDDEFVLDIDPASGIAVCSFMQYGPAFIQILSSGGNAVAWTAPGEDAELYLDMRQSGSWTKTRVPKFGGFPQTDSLRKALRPLTVRPVYASGTYGDLTNAFAVESWRDLDRFSLDVDYTDVPLYEMSADEYTDYIMSEYRALSDSIAGCGAGRMTEGILRTTLAQEALYAIIDSDMLRKTNYMDINGLTFIDLYRKKITLPEVDTMTVVNYSAIRDIHGINSPGMLLGMKLDRYLSCIDYLYPSVAAIAGLEDGLIPDLNAISGMEGRARTAGLTEQDFRRLGEMDNPFYLEALKTMQQKTLEEMAREAVVQEVPDADGEGLFDAIIAPHRGKVVLVDFWNTWCAPCRAAIRASEPLKETDLASDSLVWIYVANESSPEEEYRAMIPSIKGLHYYLDAGQWSRVAGKFGITQIPAYVLVDRDGNYSLREDFVRDRDLMVRTLRKMLGKE